MLTRPHRFVLSALLPLAIVSCEAPGPTPLDYGVRSVPKQDRAAMLDTIEAAMVRAGFHVEKRDSVTGVVTSLPHEGKLDDPDAADARRSRGRTRRVAEVQFQDSGDPVRVYCRVLVQELATGAYGLYAQERTTTDSPGEYTPINRDAATTEKQNTVWRTVRRDKTAERAILDQIRGSREDGP